MELYLKDKDGNGIVVSALYPLEDDETGNGGVAFNGERLLDFMLDGFTEPKTIEELNFELKKCGIKEIPKNAIKIV